MSSWESLIASLCLSAAEWRSSAEKAVPYPPARCTWMAQTASPPCDSSFSLQRCSLLRPSRAAHPLLREDGSANLAAPFQPAPGRARAAFLTFVSPVLPAARRERQAAGNASAMAGGIAVCHVSSSTFNKAETRPRQDQPSQTDRNFSMSFASSHIPSRTLYETLYTSDAPIQPSSPPRTLQNKPAAVTKVLKSHACSCFSSISALRDSHGLRITGSSACVRLR